MWKNYNSCAFVANFTHTFGFDKRFSGANIEKLKKLLIFAFLLAFLFFCAHSSVIVTQVQNGKLIDTHTYSQLFFAGELFAAPIQPSIKQSAGEASAALSKPSVVKFVLMDNQLSSREVSATLSKSSAEDYIKQSARESAEEFINPYADLHAEKFSTTEEEAEEQLRESVESLLENLDITSLEEYLSSLSDFSAWDIKEKILELLNGGVLDYESVFSAVFSFLSDAVKDILPVFALVCAITLLCGVLNAVKASFLQNSTTEIIFFVCYTAVLVVLLSPLINIFSLCINTLQNLQTQMQIIFPLLLTLMAASGGTVSAAVYQPAVAFLCGGTAEILTAVVIPLTVVIIILSMVGNFSKNINLQGFVSLFKSTNKWLIGLSLAVFGIFLSVQGLTSATYDGISLRAAKYAISNAIPIIGGFISSGFDLVLVGSMLIKNSVGMIGIFLLFSAVLQPVLLLGGFSLGLRFTGAVCQLIGDERIALFLGQLSDGMGYFIACLLGMAFLYFLTVLLLICSAGVIL